MQSQSTASPAPLCPDIPDYLAARYDAATLTAYARYQRRSLRREDPAGHRNRAGRRWPLEIVEARACCARVRAPSRAWPNSLLRHCCTADHVAALEGVGPRRLRSLIAAVARYQMPARTAPRDLCRVCWASWLWEHRPRLTLADFSDTFPGRLIPIPDYRADMSRHLPHDA